MNYRMLTVAGTLVLGLGLASAASAQNMQPGMGGMQQGGQMQRGGMEQGSMGQGGMQRGMRSRKMMKKKKMMNRNRGRM